ncbi:MAG: FHA domain-containing protein [Sedimentisphaerales bacterium]|nr:FHA domain-containing protein [Sedimentisphaerales bacterium]
MNEHDPILLKIDKLIRLSRLKDIEFIMNTDVAERKREIRAALERLHGGAYLLGTGPSTVGIVSLNTDEVVLGRPPTIMEEPSDCGPDYYAADTLFFVPREVSRIHAKVIRHTTGRGIRHIVIDLDSTCGTFVNDARVDPGGEGAVLAQADVISLGPSRTSTYVYYRTEAPAHPAANDCDTSADSWVWLPEDKTP